MHFSLSHNKSFFFVEFFFSEDWDFCVCLNRQIDIYLFKINIKKEGNRLKHPILRDPKANKNSTLKLDVLEQNVE